MSIIILFDSKLHLVLFHTKNGSEIYFYFQINLKFINLPHTKENQKKL